jgi:hypothetical protein
MPRRRNQFPQTYLPSDRADVRRLARIARSSIDLVIVNRAGSSRLTVIAVQR